jgi:hypothetical protein
VFVPYGKFHLFSDDFYLYTSLLQDLIRVEFLLF